ncbi:MAG: heparinase II/III family protein [Sedimentisphaerales bacterium]|nr:heparinase II/III family protein [Sedimentisphaerales bacterium]
MNRICKVVLIMVSACCTLAPAAQAGDFIVEPAEVLRTLDKTHPRLMLKDTDLRNLKERYPEDEVLRKCIKDVIDTADGYLNRPPLVYKKIGPRLLSVSRACVSRVYALGLAYRWTQDEKYARKALDNLLAVCAFDNWNPSHFLDTAEMSHAVGIGYDWLYSYMDPETRSKVKAGLIKNGLEEGLTAYKKLWWAKSEHNWNQVCNSGLIVGALAIAESDPKYAEQIVASAVKSLPLAIKTYGPDGAWGEGPGYWHYASRYTAYGLTALDTALGKDFGLTKIKGLAEAATFPIYMTGPTGYYLNLADSGEWAARRTMPCVFWFARTYENSLYAEAEHAEIARRAASPEHVVWYVSPPEGKKVERDLDRMFRGPVEAAVFRSSWDDPDALFVGVKAGYNQVNHGHLDLGNFELDALGLRWARDLGSDDYNMPGYWDGKRGGRRWTYYRLNSKSHNVPLLGGENQDPYAKSNITAFSGDQADPFAIIDLTTAYQKFTSKTTRGVKMVHNRRAVLVQDEFEIDKPCEVVWAMTTDAKITTRSNGSAALTLKGKELTARILSPAGAQFTVESAEQKPPEKKNAGVSRLIVRLPEAKGNLRLAILLSPEWKKGAVETAELKPIAQW